LGFLGWAWNYNNPSTLDMVPGQNWQYNSDADLTAWGNLIVNDSSYGLKTVATPASIFRSAIAGDANMNGVVDSADFSVLATNFNKSPGQTWALGDFNADGIVNALDFNQLASHYGATASPPLPAPSQTQDLFSASSTKSLVDFTV